MANFVVQIEDQYGNAVSGSGANVTLTPSSGSIYGGASATTASSGAATFSSTVMRTAVSGATLTAAAPSLTGATSTSFNITAGTANKLAFATQPSASTSAGATMANFVVQVEDQYGNAVSGSGANVTLTPSSGSIYGGASATTASSGAATFSSTVMRTAVSGATFTAAAPSLTGATSTSFNITAGTANKLAFTTQPPASTGVGVAMATFTVQVEDQYGNAVSGSGANVTLTASSGSIYGGASATTASSGAATFSSTVMRTAVSGATFTAAAPSLTSATSTSFNITAGTANKLAFTTQPPASTSAGVAMASFVVQVEDQYGNAVSGSGANVTLTASSGSIYGGASATTTSSGAATFGSTVMRTAVSGATFTATATSLTGATNTSSNNDLRDGAPIGQMSLTSATSTSFNITAGTANKLAFTTQPPATTTAGATMAGFSVQVEDQYGNAVSGSGTNVTLTPSSGSIYGGASATTASSGAATFSSTIMRTAVSGATFTAAAPSLGSATSSSFNITAGTASQLAFSIQPASTNAGAIMATFAVQVVDQYSNAVANSGTNVTLSPSSGTISSGNNPQTTDGGGTAMFTNIVMQTAGVYTFTASSPSLTSGSSTNFTIWPAAASRLAFTTEPISTAAGSTLSSIVVQLQDTYGNALTNSGTNVTLTLASASVQVVDQNTNAVSNSGTNVTMAPSGGVISSGSNPQKTDGTGAAAFTDIVIQTAGIYTFTASSPSLASGSSTNFTISIVVESMALQIQNSAQGVQLSWPITGESYVLQSRSTMAPSDAWVNWAGAPESVNGRFVLTVPPSGPALFFRLYKP
jgi:hypothetical protein